jgi:hypothetical protein
MIRRVFAAISIAGAIPLAACTSTESPLSGLLSLDRKPASEPAAPATVTVDPATIALPQPAAAATTAGAAATPVATVARVQLAPIVGSTVEAVTPLSARLAQRAGEHGMRITASNDPTTTHVLKGYFSAFSEGRDTTVIYVWDLLDKAGNRLHRIQGQERTPARGANAWASVPAGTMERIADRTIADLAGFLARTAG